MRVGKGGRKDMERRCEQRASEVECSATSCGRSGRKRRLVESRLTSECRREELAVQLFPLRTVHCGLRLVVVLLVWRSGEM